MLKILCPYCRTDFEEEDFSYAGEAFIARPLDPEALDDKQWGDYLFMRNNIKGKHWEQWQHSAGCRKYLLVQRNTINNTIYGSFTFDKAKELLTANGDNNATH